MSASLERLRQPNWLLRGLILASLVVHFFIFLHIAGLYRSNVLTYIELTLTQPVPQRSLPRPRTKPKLPPPPPAALSKPLLPTPLTPRPPDIAAPAVQAAPSMPAAIEAPSQITAPIPEVAQWSPAPAVQQAQDFDTAQNYLAMVKLRIESHKRYPDSARIRQVEGSATIGFTISLDGTLKDSSLAQSSGHESLDMAALQAVRDSAPFPPPPPAFFSEEISLQVTIQFELT